MLAEPGGAEEITLTVNQIPSHFHAMLGSGSTATGTAAANAVVAASTGATVFPYGADAPLVTVNPTTITLVGGSQPHTNFQPYLCVDFIISLFGIFPSPT